MRKDDAAAGKDPRGIVTPALRLPDRAAGGLKLPSLAGTTGAHIHGQILLGVVVTAVVAYLSVRFLLRSFRTRALTPFAIYCLAFGAFSIIRFAI
jgi:undecaprenyl-diphosphatase